MSDRTAYFAAYHAKRQALDPKYRERKIRAALAWNQRQRELSRILKLPTDQLIAMIEKGKVTVTEIGYARKAKGRRGKNGKGVARVGTFDHRAAYARGQKAST